MKLKILYKGREITARDLDRLSRCFGEKIDDMRLCRVVVLRILQSHNALARSALARALDTGICGPGEGGRFVRSIIRRARREMGYRYTWLERYDRFMAVASSHEGLSLIVWFVGLPWRMLCAVLGSSRHFD